MATKHESATPGPMESRLSQLCQLLQSLDAADAGGESQSPAGGRSTAAHAHEIARECLELAKQDQGAASQRPNGAEAHRFGAVVARKLRSRALSPEMAASEVRQFVREAPESIAGLFQGFCEPFHGPGDGQRREGAARWLCEAVTRNSGVAGCLNDLAGMEDCDRNTLGGAIYGAVSAAESVEVALTCFLRQLEADGLRINYTLPMTGGVL